jgi:hypothetical protein
MLFFNVICKVKEKKYFYVKIECNLLPFVRACNVKKKMLCVKVNCHLSRTVSGILSRLGIERIFL